jgi:hypothetical protein
MSFFVLQFIDGSQDLSYLIFFGFPLEILDESMINGREPMVSGEVGRKALEIILVGYEASRTGTTVYRNKHI